ncbi:putative bifunctional diguanylate cyclase/phosphodiesterase [Niveispirillum fermenti]|uniref:putative bifunctional diguanylate cyclase/phosphodiesterase n=1 Tax=Niveispirillum fermenti TaxID=1233113 RepID=UPI0040415DDD
MHLSDHQRHYLASIVESSDDAIIGEDLDGRITSWNRAAEKLFGYGAAEMLGQPAARLLPAEMAQDRDILDRISRGQPVGSFDTIRLHRDGRPLHLSVAASPILDGVGKVIGASMIARDITARRRVEERLELTASVFDHCSEAVAIIDADGVFIEVNGAFATVTGYSREEVLGRTAFLFQSGRQGPELYHRMFHDLIMTGCCKGEVWTRRKDGQSLAGLLTVSRIRDGKDRVARYIAIFADVTPLRLQQERVQRLAHYDPLTNLPNRLLLSDRLRQAVLHARRTGQEVVVAYLDLDGFKEINDSHGHAVGDEALNTVSRRIQGTMRATDTLARIGGDEFVLVLGGIDDQESYTAILDRVLETCRRPIMLGSASLQVSASIGVTVYPTNSSDVDQLLRHADQAMYDVKQSGRNRIHFFDVGRQHRNRHLHARLNSIERAFGNGEFVLYYQPRICLRDGSVAGAEALIRWQDPQRGLVGPGDFLPLIQDHPLIERLGAWVIDSALDQVAAWSRQGMPTPVSINVAPRHFLAGGFLDDLLSRLRAHPLVTPEMIELELVETSALEDTARVAAAMERSQQAGLRFAIDDFGTGYSSLTYLKTLPAEILKIDRSFVQGMMENERDEKLVRAIVGMADAFDRMVVAEGVECVEQGVALAAMGCWHIQGFAIARPMPPARFERWSAAWLASRQVTDGVFDLPATVDRCRRRLALDDLLSQEGAGHRGTLPTSTVPC